MIKFRPRPAEPEAAPKSTTVLGTGANFRGTLMVTGVLRIDGEFEGDILNCEHLEIGEHGVMRSDVEVKEALVMGRVFGNVRALGRLQIKAGARVEGDVTAMSVEKKPAMSPTRRMSRPPWMIWFQTSRPLESVPRGCAGEGG